MKKILIASFLLISILGLIRATQAATYGVVTAGIMGNLSSACSLFADATTCAKQLGWADPRQFGGFCDNMANNNTHDDTAALTAAAATGVRVMIPYPACKMASKLTVVRDGTVFFSPGAGLAYNSDIPVAPYIWIPNNLAANRASTGNCAIDTAGYDGTTFQYVDFRANFGLEGTVAVCNGTGIRSPRGAAFTNFDHVSFLNMGAAIGSPMTSFEDFGSANPCTPTGTLGDNVNQLRLQSINFIGTCMGAYGNMSDVHGDDIFFANVRHQGLSSLPGFGSGWNITNVRGEYSGFGGGDGTIYHDGVGVYMDAPYGVSLTGLICDHQYGQCTYTGPNARNVHIQANAIDSWYTALAGVSSHGHFVIDGSSSVTMDITGYRNAVTTPYTVVMLGSPDYITIRSPNGTCGGAGTPCNTAFASIANTPAHLQYQIAGLTNSTVGTNTGFGNIAPGALVDIGLAGTTLGVARLNGNTSGYTEIAPSAAAGSWRLTLPTTDGTTGDLLQNANGTGGTTWATPQAVTDLPAASTVDANTLFPCRENGETTDNKCTGTQIKAYAGATTANQQTIDAVGTVYSLTATPAAVDFGTTDPVITVSAAGTYLIVADCVLRLNGATFAADRTVTMKLRRTNNTAADLTGATRAYDTGAVSGLTATLAHFNVSAIYTTANVNDSVTIFGDVSVVATVGSLDVNSCSIRAIRLQQ